MEELPKPVIINGQPQIVDKLYEESYVYYNTVSKLSDYFTLYLDFTDPYDIDYLKSISSNPSAISGPYTIQQLGLPSNSYWNTPPYVAQIVIPASGSISFSLRTNGLLGMIAYAQNGVVMYAFGSPYHYFNAQDILISNTNWEWITFLYDLGTYTSPLPIAFVNTTTVTQTVYINVLYNLDIFKIPTIINANSPSTYYIYRFRNIGTSMNKIFNTIFPKENIWINTAANTGGSTVTLTVQFNGFFYGSPIFNIPISTTVYQGTGSYQYVAEYFNIAGRYIPVTFNISYSTTNTVTVGIQIQHQPVNLFGPDQGYNIIYDTGQQTINASSTTTLTLYNVYPYYVNLKRIQLARDSTPVSIYLYDQFGHQITGLYGTSPSGTVLLSDVTALYPYLQAVTVVVVNSDTVSHSYRVYAEGDYRQVILL
mgnify:CR=1 FL=1